MKIIRKVAISLLGVLGFSACRPALMYGGPPEEYKCMYGGPPAAYEEITESDEAVTESPESQSDTEETKNEAQQ